MTSFVFQQRRRRRWSGPDAFNDQTQPTKKYGRFHLFSLTSEPKKPKPPPVQQDRDNLGDSIYVRTRRIGCLNELPLRWCLACCCCCWNEQINSWSIIVQKLRTRKVCSGQRMSRENEWLEMKNDLCEVRRQPGLPPVPCPCSSNPSISPMIALMMMMIIIILPEKQKRSSTWSRSWSCWNLKNQFLFSPMFTPEKKCMGIPS